MSETKPSPESHKESSKDSSKEPGKESHKDEKVVATESPALRNAQPHRKEVVLVLPKVHAPRWIQGFVDFVREQGVVGLAVGIVLGAQIKTLVDAFVASFINPTISLFLPGGGDLPTKVAKVTFNGKTQTFAWGIFVSQFISFIFVCAIVYFLVKGLKLDKLDKKKV